MSEPTAHGSHGGCAHHHHHLPFGGGLLSRDEQRRAARQLSLAMLALGLLLLGLAWRWLAADQAGVSQILLGVASLLVALPVARSAWDSLRHPSLHGVTDQLIALAMLGAWASGDLLTAALLPIIMIFGHVLEERSVIGSQEAIAALGELTRSHARRIEADGSLSEVDNASLRAGDQVEVRAGDRVPADGRVLQGQASLDTAPITGESVPLEVAPGMEVYGGAINLDGLLRIEITRTGEASTLGKVIGLMQQAERAKPPITRLLERYAGQYMLLVLLIAAVTWFVTNDAQAMLAVLVAACPCALVLSAPATAIAGIAVAARHGILIRSSAFLEELADLTSLVVDKTGTLTPWQPAPAGAAPGRCRRGGVGAAPGRQPRCRQQPSGEPSAGSPGGARCLSSIERYSRTPGVRRGRTNSGGRSRPRPARTVPATGHRRQRGAGA